MSTLIVVCLLAALVAGLMANRRVRPFADSEIRGVKLEALKRNTQVFALVGLASILIVVQLAIADMDRPYSGFIEVPPTDVERVAGDLGEDFGEDWPGQDLPCDARGRPTGAAGLSS